MKNKALTDPINKEDLELFNSIRDPEFINFALLAVNFQGIKTNCICSLNKHNEDYIISPLYIQVREDMKDFLKCPDGYTPSNKALNKDEVD